jgi:hypothetical protein
MEDNKGRKLKQIKLEDLKFEANGNEYFIEPEISAERFAKMQEFEIELGFGINYKTMLDGLGEAYQLLNEGKNADAAVHIHHIREGIVGLENREFAILQYCACMINTMDEDRREWNEQVMNNKIKDWNAEGIDYRCFFPLAINMVRGLKESYVKFTQDISKSEK